VPQYRAGSGRGAARPPRPAARSQRALPNAAPIRSGDQAVGGIDLLELALGEGRLVAQALELLSARALGAGLRLLVGTDCAGIGIEFDRRERGEEGLNHFRVHGSSRDILEMGDPRSAGGVGCKDSAPPLLYCTTSLCPQAPQYPRPCTRAAPGRGMPRVFVRSYSA